LFSKTIQKEETDDELTTLEQEKAQLSQQISNLSAQARTTDYLPVKKELILKKGKQQALQSKIDKLKEAAAIEQIKQLITANAADILFYINSERVRVPTDLNVEVPFTCGRHKLRMPIYEVLRFQTTMQHNTTLLAYWNSAIANHETRVREIRCEKCMRERRLYSVRNHVASNRPTGIVKIKIQVVK
jgi:hypothetical protein